MKTIRFLILAGMLVFLLSCEKSVEMNFPEVQSQVVIDGWIEQDGPPRVLLTRSLPYFSEIDSASFRNLVISKAKVSVSVDSITEILTLHYDDQYFPPYIYQGFQIKGETGKSYLLKVTIGGDTLTANTTIPDPPAIDSLWTVSHPIKDTLSQIMVQFSDEPEIPNYYRLFSRIHGFDDYYKPAYASVFNDQSFNGSTVSFPLFKGYTTNQSREDLFFTSDDTVYVKLSTIGETSYNFWKNFQSEQMNSVNPFASSALEIEGNIGGNGKGIWTGYGSDYGRIVIR